MNGSGQTAESRIAAIADAAAGSARAVTRSEYRCRAFTAGSPAMIKSRSSRGVGDVCNERSPTPFNRRERFVEFVCSACDDRDRPAGRGERLRERAAESASTTGDDGRLAAREGGLAGH